MRQILVSEELLRQVLNAACSPYCAQDLGQLMPAIIAAIEQTAPQTQEKSNDHKLVPLRPPESILAVVRKAYGNATAYDVGHVWHEIYTRLPDAAPVQEPVTWNQVQVCTWIGNQLMTQPSMFERNAVCKFVRSLGRNEKLAKYFPAPMAAQPRKAVKLTDDEILTALDVEYVSSAQNRGLFLSDARTIEAAVWAKLGVEPCQ